MKLALCLAILLAGCTSTVTRIEFSCVSAANDAGQIQTDCADIQSWKEYLEKKQIELQSTTESKEAHRTGI